MDKKHIILSILFILPFLGLEMSPLSGSWIISSIIWFAFLVLLAIYNKKFIKQIRIQRPFILASQLAERGVTQCDDYLRETATKEYPREVIKAMDSLIKRGDFLCSQMQDKDFLRTGLITPIQEWLDKVNRQVWDNVPNHASYITGEQGGLTGDERIRYQGWANESAMLRISVDRRLSRLRQVRSQIQGSHSEDSQTEQSYYQA